MVEEFNNQCHQHQQVQKQMPPTSSFLKSFMLLNKCQSHTLMHDRIKWKHYKPPNHEILKTIKFVEFLVNSKITVSPYEIQ